MKKLIIGMAVFAGAGVCLAAELVNPGDGSEASKPQGFHFFDNHLTVKPYVALSYTYDSNVDTAHKADYDSIFSVNPGANFTWKGERWNLVGTLWYRYNSYTRYSSRLGENSYGESLAYEWNNIDSDGRGWDIRIAERYAYFAQNDDINGRDGRGVWRDRQKMDVTGVFERRITEKTHAEVLAQYNWLDYKNDTAKYAPLYGWSQRAVAVGAGHAFSPWTDLLVQGGYSDYTQKKGRGYKHYSNDSQVWSVHGGIGSHLLESERIKYRVLMGFSQLSYGGHDNVDSGWTYQLSASWLARQNLRFSLLGNSYYQPSERSLGQAIKVYALSGGVSYQPPSADKLTLTGNISWRLEENVYSDRYLANRNDYDEYLLSVRFGVDYIVNRYFSLYANFTWEENWCESHSNYNYDRFRGTVGMRFHY